MKLFKKPITASFVLVGLICVIYFMSSSKKTRFESSVPITMDQLKEHSTPMAHQIVTQSEETEQKQIYTETGDAGFDAKDTTETPFMPKMANETLKAELGRASWRLFHTILARYPDSPTDQEQSTLSQYIHLFAQVYPCGDCARHFTGLLAKYPPQTSSRKNAAVWGCHIHNKVNERLDKPEYDCTTILEDYDCGCGSDEQEQDHTLGNESMDHLRSIKIDEKVDGLQLGG